jgi:response regulator of citrate/malate metabolism
VSANALATDIQPALDAGFVDYITKPFTIERVTALLERFTVP